MTGTTQPPSSAPPPAAGPERPGWVQLAVTVVLAAAVMGDAFHLWAVGRTAPMAHLVSLPLLAFWIPASVAFLVVLVIALRAMLGQIRAQWARLPVIALTLILFVDAFLLPDVRSSIPAFDIALPVQSLGSQIYEATSGPTLPSTVEEILPAAKSLGAPSLLDHGVRPAEWALVVRSGCTGPLEDAAGLAPGTFVYCLSSDRRHAWITAVAPGDAMFGPPSIATSHGRAIVSILDGPPAPSEALPPEGPAPSPPPARDAGSAPARDAG